MEPSSKYSSKRRCNGYLRRPEVLETVYSVEEDTDADKTENSAQSCQEAIDKGNDPTEQKNQEQEEIKNTIENPRLRDHYGSYERLVQPDACSIEDASNNQRQQHSTTNQRPREENRAQVRILFL